jgi:hypothetical protein
MRELLSMGVRLLWCGWWAWCRYGWSRVVLNFIVVYMDSIRSVLNTILFDGINFHRAYIDILTQSVEE